MFIIFFDVYHIYEAYRGHDLDLSGSSYVIGHMTIRFHKGNYLFASSDTLLGKTHRLVAIDRPTLQTDANIVA